MIVTVKKIVKIGQRKRKILQEIKIASFSGEWTRCNRLYVDYCDCLTGMLHDVSGIYVAQLLRAWRP